MIQFAKDFQTKYTLNNLALKALASFWMLFVFMSTNAQQDISKDSTVVINVIKTMPSFSIHNDNYFITGTTIGETPDANNSDGKLKIGFKQRLTNKTLPFDTYLFFTYQQTAFWNIYKKSLPFRETNYNPSLALVKPLYRNKEFNGFLQFQFEHESNGRDADSSRSWNRLSLIYRRYLSDNFTGTFKLWLPVGAKSGNTDITDYRGFQQLDLAYKLNEDFIFETELRKAFSLDTKGSLLLGANYRISQASEQFIYLQYFLGYSEDLIAYDQHVHRIRIGIVFKDLFLKFRK